MKPAMSLRVAEVENLRSRFEERSIHILAITTSMNDRQDRVGASVRAETQGELSSLKNDVSSLIDALSSARADISIHFLRVEYLKERVRTGWAKAASMVASAQAMLRGDYCDVVGRSPATGRKPPVFLLLSFDPASFWFSS